MLSVRGLRVAYNHVEVLHAIDFDVPDGSVVALLGANGAGKSTTLKAISGVARTRSGKIAFDERDITNADPSAIVGAGIVHCPEGRQVFPGLSVRENLFMGAYRRGRTSSMDRILDIFPALKSRLQQSAGTLSGGEQQMLAIGRALMAEPRLLMLDEPSLGLAPVIVEHIFDIIGGLRHQGVAVLLVEQNAMLALELADWAYALTHGEIRISDSASSLRESESIHHAYLGAAP